MKRYLIYSLVFILASCSSVKKTDTASDASQAQNGQLRFDGMYYKEGVITQNRSYNQNYTYLRFYPDGTVIRVATASEPDDASRWLNKKRTSSDTKYKLKNNSVSFATNVNGDIMDYEGEIMENKIRMSVYSGGNNYVEDYYFMQMDLPAE